MDMKQDGASLAEICEAVGMNPTTVCRAWASFKAGGYDALKGGRRGRREGEKRSLSETDEKRIRKKIVDRLPSQLKLDFALWTRDAVRQLINQETGIEMPVRTVGEYLKRWGFTPQKPIKFAYERKPEAVKKWLDVDYPQIRERANTEKAEIYWGDETGLRSNDVRGRGFSPKGKTPVIHVSSKHENLSMVSAITNKGKLHWMIVDVAVNQHIFLEFLKGLMKESSRKIFLILDNLKVHHGKTVSAWAKKNEKHIELFFLPAYSPDLNPDEHLNADLKQGVGTRAPGRSKRHLAKAAEHHLAMIKGTPSRIREYFKDPAIAYAALHV